MDTGFNVPAVAVAPKDQLIAEYDASNNMIYLGKAKAGALTSDSLWQIAKLTYDGSNNLTNIKFPSASTAYAFVWNSRAGYSYS